MPKPGKHINHKGRNRRFTNPEELEEERRREEQARKWKEQRGEISSEEEASGDQDSENDSEDEDESSEDESNKKAKGVSNLIEIENPNRVQKKNKKLTTLSADAETPPEKPQLSRREREEIEKQRAQAHYQKLHAEGKTEQARADLARLAIIKQQREEAQKRRELEKKVIFIFIAICFALSTAGIIPAAYVVPYATSYSAHAVNHAIAAPAVAPVAPIVAAPAPVAYSALPYTYAI
ncbi:28 kda heat- and acid-stable phosphoprotein pdgf-associated protein [Holotrichia oblita]|uniref:28 kDa heat- and acid-stable phosphoprotein pdgf-associated protein n=1 Tax=Holotrichia oblita TaxID=644536 RepID=A0ACB9SQT2_HOLOL|nr:28 kda heat- and acid-stable phosphoprotein pdgf-associated protein [Holotrichia oblita]